MDMKFVNYLGDNRLRHKIIYDKKSYSDCIYCGEEANTREHIPSKVFLSRPFPENLAIVPACSNCNNSFSNDELFLSLLIERLKCRSFTVNYAVSEDMESRQNQNERLVNDIDEAIENGRLDELENKILRILHKLAIGHAVYELAEGYCIKDGKISYSFVDRMSLEEVDDFTLPYNITNEPLPEVGNRVFDRILILELQSEALVDSEERVLVPLILLDWVDVQDEKYTYTCYKFGDYIEVKMIINDYMYVKVVLQKEAQIEI